MILKNKILIVGVLALMVAGAIGYKLYAHCQIPCGIYDDPARFTLLKEHVTTLEKSVNQILELSKDTETNWNQIVRWVKNKEHHADDFTHLVTYYFMAQRIKPVGAEKPEAHKKYISEVTMLHEMVFYAMKVKQTTSSKHINKLRDLINRFESSYMGK